MDAHTRQHLWREVRLNLERADWYTRHFEEPSDIRHYMTVAERDFCHQLGKATHWANRALDLLDQLRSE
jgi:hypothetical protein